MKKKLLSALLVFAVASAFVPAAVFAEDVPLQGSVEEITSGLTQQGSEIVSDAGDPSKTAAKINVSVTPTAKIQFSEEDQDLGRDAGWWAGIKIKAPASVTSADSNDVKFRNSADGADKAWVEPAIDGGTGTADDPYWMAAWNGIKEGHLTQGETAFTVSWYFNWDGDENTGVTVAKESFAASSAAEMKGVDQIISFTFNLSDSIQLMDKNGTDVVWPGAQTVKVRGNGVEDGVENVKYSEAYTKAGLTLGSRSADGSYTLTIDKTKLEAVVAAGSGDETYKILENAGNPGKLLYGMEYPVPDFIKGSVKSVSVKFDNGGYTPVELNTPSKDGFYNYIKVYDGAVGPVKGETATIKWLGENDKLLTITKAVVKVEVEGTAEETKYTVTFESNGGSEVEEVVVSKGGTVTKPTDPKRDGYTFDGWYVDEECTEVWNFSTQVTGDMTLYAKWTEDDPDDPNNPDDPDDPDEEQDEYSISVDYGRHGTVSVSSRYAEPGEKVTITVDPETDYYVSWISAEQSNGRRVYLDQSGRRYTFTMPSSDVDIEVEFSLQVVYTNYYQPVEPVQSVVKPVFVPVAWRPAVSLPDVPAYSWSYPAAQWAYQNGYLDLAADGTFRLNGTVSHQQMWKVMAQWMGVSASNEQAVMSWARQNGAARGKSATAAMTRQNVVIYLYESYFMMGGDVTVTGNLSAYADSRLITTDAAKNAWIWAVNKGIISGTAEGYLNPNQVVTRGEFAMMLMRLCQLR